MKKSRFFLLIALLIVFEFLIYLIEPQIGDKADIIVITFISVFTIGYLVYCKKNNCINYKTIAFLIIVLGILLRNLYILKTTIYERQHDVETLDSNGHLKYIYNLFKTGKLPATRDWQFYHPPLFHLLGAGWLKINSILGFSLDRSLEGLQILTVIFSSLTLIISYKIIDRLKIKDYYKVLLTAFMAFYPTFIILSGSINNDCLLTLLQFSIIYYLIKWYENTNWINTIILALLTGLCVMTKLNGAIMAVPILYVFIKKFIEYFKEDKSKIKKLILFIVVFGLISLPIGLWYQVREMIMFNNTDVPKPGNFLYIGNYSIFKRFFYFSFESFVNTFCTIPGDYNMFTYIIKTSLFGEYSYGDINFIHFIMLTTNLLLIVISIYYTIKYCIKRKEHSFIINILLFVWLSNMASFYVFNYKYPYICSMDFRYIVPTVFTGIVLIGKNINDKNNTVVDIILYLFLFSCFIFPFMI